MSLETKRSTLASDSSPASAIVIEYYKIWDKGRKRRGGLQQALGEVTTLKNIIGDRKFNNYTELGVCDAGSLWLYSQLFCTPQTVITGFDIASLDSRSWKGTRLVINSLRNDKNRNVKYIESDCNKYAPKIKDNSIDFLHIDANHDYNSVVSYFKNYYPKVAHGGIILIHDTAACPGSIKFRKEILEPNYNHELIVGEWLITGEYDKNPNIPSPGISLIRKH